MSRPPSPANAAVCVLGSINLDHFEWDDGRRRVVLGGMALTAWTVLTTLGRPARLVSSVGTDAEGDEVLARMRRQAIAADDVARVAGSATGRAVYRVRADGTQLLDLRLHPGLGSERLATLHDGCGPLLVMGAPLRDAAAVAAVRPLYWNPGQGVLREGQREVPWPRADVLFVNRREWETYRRHDGPACRITVVTRHHAGASLLLDGEEIAVHRPPEAHRGLDVGAGDAFAAAFTHAHLAGQPLADCLVFAAECAQRFLRERLLR